MNELQWTPAQIGGLTLHQVVALTAKKPPRRGGAADHESGWGDRSRRWRA